MSIPIQDSVIHSDSSNAAKLVLVDTRVQEKDVFLNSVKTNVTAIILDFENDTYNSILTKIKNNMIHDTLESIALVSHGQYNDNYSFLEKENSPKLKNISVEDPNFDSWKIFLDFLIELKDLTSIKYLDLLGCAIVSYNEWKLILTYLESNSGINIRASADNTGNLVAGGNWILETDNNNIDAKELYFTDEILNFEGLLLNTSINFDTSTSTTISTNDSTSTTIWYNVSSTDGSGTNTMYLVQSVSLNSNNINPRYSQGLLLFYLSLNSTNCRYYVRYLDSVEMNTTHTIYFWMYHYSTSNVGTLEVIQGSSTNTTIPSTDTPSPTASANNWTVLRTINSTSTTGWHRYSATFTSDSSTSKYYWFGLRLSAQQIILDEIQILQGSITTHPVNQITISGANFSVSVYGAITIPTYQWQSSVDDNIYTDVAGAITNTYSATALTNKPIMYYRCLINGQVHTNSAFLLNPNYMFPTLNIGIKTLNILPMINYIQSGTDLSNNFVVKPIPNINNKWQTSNNNTSWNDIFGATLTNYTPTEYNKYIKYSGDIYTTNSASTNITTNSIVFKENTNFDIDISGTQFKFSQNGIDYINPKLGLDYHIKYTFNLKYTVNSNTLLRFYDISNTEYIQSTIPSGMIKYFDISNIDITNDISNDSVNISNIKKIEFTNKILYNKNLDISANSTSTLLSPLIIANSSTQSISNYLTQINYKGTGITGNSIIFKPLPTYLYSAELNTAGEDLYRMQITGANNTSIDFTSDASGQRNVIGLKNATTQYVELYPNSNYSMIIIMGATQSTTCTYKLFIDYNGDGDFIDVSEEVFIQPNGNNATVSGIQRTHNFFIPTSIVATTNLLRMRIITVNGSNPVVNSFGIYSFGSTYDFSARIIQPPTISYNTFENMSKYALLIGINYNKTQNRLYGCINDVIVIRKYLIEKRGYSPENITVLRDDDASFLLPNRDNILTKFRELINTANINNSSEIFFHYSGHGSSGPDNNSDEKDGNDEYICPVDFNFIRDDDIRSLLSNLNNSTILLSVMDCCNSGTNMDLPYLYNQVGGKIIMLEDNSNQYANLLSKNIYSLSGCRDDQTSADAYNVYSVLTDLSDNKYNITEDNKSGGALTSTLLQLLNKTNTVNFINILDQLQINIKNSYYTQIPLLSSSKNIIVASTSGDPIVASTSGDPYINTFAGFKYKLPNIIRTYRLLDFHMTDKCINDTLTINASVSPLREEEKNIIMSIDKFKKHNPVINGFFYNEFYISTNNSYILLDRMFNLIKCSNIRDFEIKLENTPKLFKCDIQGESLYVAKIIYIFGVRIELRLFDNPQILNGIEISVPYIKNVSGLLSSRINPKNFMIKTITDTKKITIKSDKVYNRVVKENWIKVA